MHSTVRPSAGIAFPGHAPEQLFALAGVRLANTGTGSGAGEEVCEEPTFFLSGAGLLLLSPLAAGVYRLVAPAPAGSAVPDARFVEDLLARRGTRAGTRHDHLSSTATDPTRDFTALRDTTALWRRGTRVDRRAPQPQE
ncbi:hypothetical protein [Streptomyces subrutilus]|uniref:hypothetical protein n=1 Tax=Streptomyces subrutilus TaxID=36818 RepID=UPI002E160353|nr:hypothetical protein OG479_33625 [Streptomyces subrutilus]